jgi:hypothetical protein
MAFTITDVITPATADEWEARILALCSSLGLTTTAWQSGSVVRTIISTFAAMLAIADETISAGASGGFLDFAASVTDDPSVPDAAGVYPTGPGWLDILASSVYAVDRIGAKYANGTMILTNVSASSYGPFAAGTYHIANPSTGKTYSNTAALTIAATTDTPATFQADEAGSASTASASSITDTVTALVGVTIDSGIQSGVLLGSNAESNAALVARCRLKLAALGPRLGPTSAYEYFALETTVPEDEGGGGITLAGGAITRVAVSASAGSGVVTVTIANATGAPSGPDVVLVDAYLQSVCVPDSVTAVVQAATAVPITVEADIWVPAAYASTILATVTTALGTLIAGYPIGGVVLDIANNTGLSYERVVATLFASATYVSQVDDVLVDAGTVDVVLTPTEVATLSTITLHVHST